MAVIHLIDDERDGVEVLALAMERAGHTVNVSCNGREALSALATMEPDVIVLDLQMPQMDGLQFLRELRDGGRGVSVPVIVITGSSDPDLPWRTAGRGVERVFLKGGYRLQELLDCIDRLTGPVSTEPAVQQHLLSTPPISPLNAGTMPSTVPAW